MRVMGTRASGARLAGSRPSARVSASAGTPSATPTSNPRRATDATMVATMGVASAYDTRCGSLKAVAHRDIDDQRRVPDSDAGRVMGLFAAGGAAGVGERVTGERGGDRWPE